MGTELLYYQVIIGRILVSYELERTEAASKRCVVKNVF